MGTWGAGLYANDCASDVRDTYMGFLRDQLSNDEAYERTLKEYAEYIGDQDEPLLWYALADTQWKTGRLMPEVKAEALKWISRRGGLALWIESRRGGVGWRKTLNDLKSRLESEMPPEKKIRRPAEFARNPWDTGDVYAYRFGTPISEERGLFGKYMLWQKIGNTGYCDWMCSAVQIYDRVFDDPPGLGDLEGLRVLPLVHPRVVNGSSAGWDEYIPSLDWYLKTYLILQKKSHYPAGRLTLVGKQSLPETYYPGNQLTCLDWEKDGMEDWLSAYYLAWQGIEY